MLEILRCFKIQKKPGLLPVLVDGGSTCVITPYLRQLILRIPNKTIISGVGTGSVSFASPIIFTAVVTTGQYEMFNFLTGYFMSDLDFAIIPCAQLERSGYELTLSASFSRTKTPAGVVVPFVRDAQTGFHFLIDHLLAAPGLRSKHNIAEHFKRSGDQARLMIFLHRLTLSRALLNQIRQPHLQHLFSQTWGERWHHSRVLQRNLQVYK